MKNKYHNYKFILENQITPKELSAYHSVKVCYRMIENEKILYSINGGGSYLLYLNDRFFSLGIDDETKRVSSFHGELTFFKIISKRIVLPQNIQDCILCLDTNNDLLDGAGGYIDFDIEIVYDKEEKILQIGKIIDNSPVCKIFENVYIQLNNGKLANLIITNIVI